MAHQVKEGQSLIVWSHGEHGTYYYAGDKVDLSHMTDEQLAALVDGGVVEAVPGPAPKPAKDKAE